MNQLAWEGGELTRAAVSPAWDGEAAVLPLPQPGDELSFSITPREEPNPSPELCSPVAAGKAAAGNN